MKVSYTPHQQDITGPLEAAIVIAHKEGKNSISVGVVGYEYRLRWDTCELDSSLDMYIVRGLRLTRVHR